MKVHILDDWFDTLRGLPCFAKLADHEVTVWTDHEADPAKLAARLQGAEALVLFRERTKVGAELVAALPNLKLISQRSVYPHVDVPACTAHGVLLCSNMHSDTPSYAAAEHTLALILASYRQIPQQIASIKAGQWQSGVGRTLRGRTLGLYGYGGLQERLQLMPKRWGSRCSGGVQRRGARGPRGRESATRDARRGSSRARRRSATRDARAVVRASDGIDGGLDDARRRREGAREASRRRGRGDVRTARASALRRRDARWDTWAVRAGR